MRFLLPAALLLGTALAAPVAAPAELTLTLPVPAGARTLVVWDGERAQPLGLSAGAKQVGFRLVVSSKQLRYSMQAVGSDGKSRNSVTSSLDGTYLVPAQVNKRGHLSLTLNRWVPVWTGEREAGWSFTLGQGRHARRKPVQVQLLFTQRQSEKVSDGLKPPQLP